VADRLRRADLAGWTVVLKLKTSDFRTLTRNHRLADPTRLADVIYRSAAALITREADGRAFRLIGVGVTDLCPPENADPPDLFDALH
jgi:DNA polymerase IV